MDAREKLTRLLAAGKSRDQPDEGAYLRLVYDELRGLAGFVAGRKAGGTLQPTELVHEAYLKLAGGRQDWEGRTHFMAVAAKAMRQVLMNHAEARRAQKRGGGWERITLSGVHAVGATDEVDMLALDEALRSLEEVDPRQARVVELRFFGGLSIEEVAMVLDVSPRTVQLDWRMARAWLRRALERDHERS